MRSRRKLAPALIAREPLAEIEALATGIFRQLLASPHVVVRVSDKLYDAARVKLEEIAQQTGFEGRLVMLAEPDIAEGDCRIEWADGGVTRDRAAARSADRRNGPSLYCRADTIRRTVL